MLKLYFLEVKNRFCLVIMSWIFSLLTCYFYKEILLFLFVKPFILISEGALFYFIFTNVTDIFSTYLKISCFITNQFTFFILCYQGFVFLSPALYQFEYNNLRAGLFLSLIFWLQSIIILNILVLPHSLNFFLSFQESVYQQTLNIYFEAKITEYVSLYITFFYLCNLNFQGVFLIFILFNYLQNKITFIKTYRKFLYILYFGIATVLTPPDIASQFVTAIILILLSEIILIFIICKIYLIRPPTKMPTENRGVPENLIDKTKQDPQPQTKGVC